MSYQSPPPPNPYGAPGGYGGGAPQGNNKKALWSLILGLLSPCCCGIFTAIPAIILGRMAKQEISQTGQQGSGMATAGFVLGIISIALTVLYAILYSTGALTFDFNTN